MEMDELETVLWDWARFCSEASRGTLGDFWDRIDYYPVVEKRSTGGFVGEMLGRYWTKSGSPRNVTCCILSERTFGTREEAVEYVLGMSPEEAVLRMESAGFGRGGRKELDG